MSFFSRLGIGFRLQQQSYSALFRHPQLLLYWLIPGILAGIFMMNTQLQFYFLYVLNAIASTLHLPHSVLYLVAMVIIQIPLTLISAAFIIHVNNIQINQRTTFAGSCSRIVHVLPWLILMPFVTELFDIFKHYLLVYQGSVATSEEAFIYAANITEITGMILKLVWGFFVFYTLVLVVLDRMNIIKAICHSIKIFLTLWVETISGQLCIRIPFFVLSLLYAGSLFVIPAITNNIIAHTIITLILVSVILPTRILQVLLYRWYKDHKEIITR